MEDLLLRESLERYFRRGFGIKLGKRAEIEIISQSDSELGYSRIF